MPPTYHSSPLQLVNLVDEGATHGAGGTPAHGLAGLRMDYWAAKGTADTVVPSGYLVPTGTIHGKEWAEAPMSGPMNFSDLIPLFDSGLIKATPSGGGPYTRLYSPVPNAINAFASYAVQQGDSVAAYGYTYAYVDSFGLDCNRDKHEVSGQWMAQRETAGVTLNGSATRLEMVPVEPQQAGLYVATAFGGSYSRLAGQFSLGLKFDKVRGQVWTLDDSMPSFSDTVNTLIGCTAQVSYAADVTGGDYFGAFTLAKWRASQTVYLRYLNTYDANHSLQIDMALQLVDPAKKDDAGIFTLDSAAQFVVGNTNKWIEITLVNQVASLG